MPKDEPPLCGHFQTTTLSKIIGINMFPCTAEMQNVFLEELMGSNFIQNCLVRRIQYSKNHSVGTKHRDLWSRSLDSNLGLSFQLGAPDQVTKQLLICGRETVIVSSMFLENNACDNACARDLEPFAVSTCSISGRSQKFLRPLELVGISTSAFLSPLGSWELVLCKLWSFNQYNLTSRSHFPKSQHLVGPYYAPSFILKILIVLSHLTFI